MNDPARWRSPDGGASPGARELLRHARAPEALGAAARARNAAAIAKITAGPVASSAFTLVTKLLLGVGLAGIVAVSATVSTRHARAPRDARPAVAARVFEAPPVAAHAAPMMNAPAATPTVEPVALPVATAHLARHEAPHAVAPARPSQPVPGVAAESVGEIAPRSEAPVRGAPLPALPSISGPSGIAGGSAIPPSAAAPLNPLDRESNLLGEAFASLDRSPAVTLERVDQLAREFPRGQLAPEREFVAVEALRHLGRVTEARARGEALIVRFPRSPVAARVRHMLDAMP